jgi:hypothetical protein
MKIRNIILLIAAVSLIAAGCGPTKPATKPVIEAEFLTLADISGSTSFKAGPHGVRIIKVKAKALIKRDDVRLAKKNALQNATKMAVEAMVRELMNAEDYNRGYKEIGNFFFKNIDQYVLDREVISEKKIYNDKYYGILAAFKVNRQATLIALQKNIKLIDATRYPLVTVITSEKEQNDSTAVNYKLSKIEDILMNQLQTNFNQSGLKAMDFRNALVSMQTNEKKKAAYAALSKEQFMAMVSGSSAKDAAFNQQVKQAEGFYSSGLTLLKELAKVVVEVNILSLSKENDKMVLSVAVTAKNIATATGGAFAHKTLNVGRSAPQGAVTNAVVIALVQDTCQEIVEEFVPQVIGEMSTVDVGGNKLVQYELVMKGFNSKQFREIRGTIKDSQTDNFRFIGYDNTLRKANPSINIVFVRYSGEFSSLADDVMDILDTAGLPAEDPIVAEDLTDLVFERLPEDD